MHAAGKLTVMCITVGWCLAMSGALADQPDQKVNTGVDSAASQDAASQDAASQDAASQDAATENPGADSPAEFVDQPEAHRLYDLMNETIRNAESLSLVSQFRREAVGSGATSCTYRLWLKKPNYFRMETESIKGEKGGVLIGDGTNLWIHWPNGRPRWGQRRRNRGIRSEPLHLLHDQARAARKTLDLARGHSAWEVG